MITKQNVTTIHDLVQQAAIEYEDHVFMCYEENDILYDTTFGQFLSLCRSISAWCTAKQKEYGHVLKVGIIGSASVPYLVTALGVMGSGNVAVPLDIQLNVDTLSDLANRSDLDVLFYDFIHYPLVEGIQPHCPALKEYICLQRRNNIPDFPTIMKNFRQEGIPANAPWSTTARPEDLAMILFTSGTTGRGKGVMLSHSNLIDNTFNYDEYGEKQYETYLCILPVHHVFCFTCDFLTGLRYGARIALNGDMKNLFKNLARFQPDVIRIVPMVARAIYNRITMAQLQTPERTLRDISKDILGKNMTRISCGGGYLVPELSEDFRSLGIFIGQGYGLSETSPKVSAPDYSRTDKDKSVGHLVRDCLVRVVDGEIQVKSPSVMMGYYKDPELTAQVMTEDGFFKTGDMGYLDEEDFLYLTGRVKNLIVLSNGENVAPEELENLFIPDPLVADILVYEDNDAIVCEIYPDHKYADANGITDIKAELEKLVEKYNAQLPTFKRILHTLVRKTPFQKTTSKKIIRSLHNHERKVQHTTLEVMHHPENELQKRLYDMAAQAIGHAQFGVDMDLFREGLDSMGVVSLLAAIHEQLGIALTMAELMKNPTIRDLEKLYWIRKKEAKKTYEKQSVYPLTTLQRYFCYIMRGNTTANLPFFFKLHPGVDLPRLQQAILDLFELHPDLKNQIYADDPEGKILVNHRDDGRKITIPIQVMTDAEFKKKRPSFLWPFTYQKNEDLFHILLIQTESSSYLLFDIAHAISDGVSMNLLFEDLNRIYLGNTPKKSDYTFYEYILDYKDWENDGTREKAKEHYRNFVSDHRTTRSILTRSVCTDLPSGRSSSLSNRFDKLNRKNLLGFCHQHNVSENVLFLTAYNYCISLFSGKDDALSTSIHGGRIDSRWDRVIGSLFLTYLFRYQRIAHETVPALLKRMGSQILDTMQTCISILHADEMFIQYQGDLLNIQQIGGKKAEPMPFQLDSLPFHLMIYTDSKGYHYELRYWENRFDRNLLQIFMKCMEEIIDAMQNESSVRRLRFHLSEDVFPRHLHVTAQQFNRQVENVLPRDLDPDTLIRPYVLDEWGIKKPFGGWGELYLLNQLPVADLGSIASTYATGTLYRTGIIARILPDGHIDTLERSGRIVYLDNPLKAEFPDLQQIEDTVRSLPEVSNASAYTRYSVQHNFELAVEITPVDGAIIDEEKVKQVCAKHLNADSVPSVVLIR